MPTRVDGSVAVVTGASSGIGQATALALAGAGAKVVLAARRSDALDQVAATCRRLGAEALAVPTDTSDEQAVLALADTAEERFGPIGIWVNNAAVTTFSRFGEEPMAEFRRVVEVDQLGYVHGARAVIPRFRDQGEGVLINVGSVLSSVPAPYLTAYVMSKFAVRALSACLRTELLDMRDVHVCTVMPGPVDTPFFAHAGNRTGWALDVLRPVATPERVAAKVLACARRPRREAFVGLDQRLTAAAHAVAPGLFERASGRLVHRGHFAHRHADPTEGNLFEPAEGSARTRDGWTAHSERTGRRVAGASAAAAVALALAARRRT